MYNCSDCLQRYSLVSGTFDRNRIEPFFKSLYAFIVYPNVCPKDFKRFKDQVIRQLYKGGANELFLDSCSNLSYNQTLLNKKLPKDKLESMVENDIQRVFKDIFCDIDNSTFIFEGNLNFEDLKPYIETYLSNLPYDSKPHIKPIFREPNWKDGEIYLKFNSNNPISSKASVTCNIKAKMPYNENNVIISDQVNSVIIYNIAQATHTETFTDTKYKEVVNQRVKIYFIRFI